MNNSLITILILSSFIISCESGKKETDNCSNFKLFNQSEQHSQNNFSPVFKEKIGVCFKQFIFDFSDLRMDYFWGIKSDTLYAYLSKSNVFEQPKLIPFLPLLGNNGDKYTYTNRKSISDTVYLEGKSWEVTLNNVTILPNNVIYKVTHESISEVKPYTSSDVESKFIAPKIKLVFEISLLHGVISFSRQTIGDVREFRVYY